MPPVVAHGSDAFQSTLEALMADRDARSGFQILFHGGTREQRQQALGTLTRYVTGPVHQFEAPSLLNERRVQTQNNLRKAFDHAAEESALLYFDKAGPLFTHTHDDGTPPANSDETAPSTLEYVFDRVAAYAGVVVLGLRRTRHREQAQDRMHLVVTFE
jgi:hypothetical protein